MRTLTMNHTLSAKQRYRGFTMIELLIAMLVAVISMLVIAQVMVVNNSYQRSTVGTSDAQTTGALALNTIETEGRMAGFGISNSALLGCGQLRYYFNNGTGCGASCYSSAIDPGSDKPQIVFVPVEIIDGAAGASDTITFTMASGAERVIPGSIKTSMTSASGDLDMYDVLGYQAGDMIVLSDTALGCTLMQVSTVNPATAKISHSYDAVSTPYNPPGAASFSAYPKDSLVINLGRPSVKRFEVSNGRLQVSNYFTLNPATSAPLFNALPQVLYEQVVNLQAVYGKDTDNDGNVDLYEVTAPATAAAWAQVLSVRVALLVRSKDQEKPVNGVCDATTSAPTWSGGAFVVPGGLPSCFKYRVFETNIPLRNMIWREA
jgi:type IV pilus assembly protein PilW